VGITGITHSVAESAANAQQGPSPTQIAALRDANQIQASALEQLVQSVQKGAEAQGGGQGGGSFSAYA